MKKKHEKYLNFYIKVSTLFLMISEYTYAKFHSENISHIARNIEDVEDCPGMNKQVYIFNNSKNFGTGNYIYSFGDISLESCIRRCCYDHDCLALMKTNSKCVGFHFVTPADIYHQTKHYDNKLIPQHQLLKRFKRNEAPDTNTGNSIARTTCLEGMMNCNENEHCNTINTRRRSGICECNEGFKQNSEGICKQTLNPQNGTEITIINTTVPSNQFDGSTSNLRTTVSSKINEIKFTTSVLDTKLVESTTTPTSVKSQPVEKLVVNINNKTIILPEGSTSFKDWATLSAYALGGTGSKYKFTWNLVDKPNSKEEGSIKNMNSQTIALSNLVAGVYIFKVAVNGTNAYGEAVGNITVHPAERVNKPPVAVIVPSSQTVKLPNSGVIFDGSGSSDDDDDGIKSFQWELVMGPLGYKLSGGEGATLQMTDLVPGNYTIMLKVKDKEGLEGNATASVVIVKETDYPPTANAGGDKIIYLPQTEITLNGNESTDDHAIIQWEWTKGPEDSGNAVDMQDTRTPYLHLSNLEEGHYHLILKVVDTAGQTTNSSAHVYLHPSTDNIPQANAGPDVTIVIPNTSVTLDGSQSNGISSQTHFKWVQLSGPNTANIFSVDKVKMNASELTRGKYVFKLTIWNASEKGKNSSSNVTVNVIQDKNAPPIAYAGGDFSVTLPVSVVIINGSASTDDVGIVKWLWKRDSTSLAAGIVIKNSDRSPVLLFTGVVPGRYIWNLTVWDDQDAFSTDTVSIIVKDGPHHLDEVEIVVGVGIESLSISQMNNLIQKLQLLLHTSSSDVTFAIQNIHGQPLAGKVNMILLGYKDGNIVKGSALAQELKVKTTANSKDNILDLPIISVDTVICQNNCSGHGECIQTNRECRCHSWWMESSFRRRFADGTPNCDWSVIYVFVGTIGTFLAIGFFIWIVSIFIVGNFRKFKHRKSKSPRYSLLEGHEDPIKIKTRIPGSLLDSGTETESDTEILFDTRKARQKSDKSKNGHIKLQRMRT